MQLFLHNFGMVIPNLPNTIFSFFPNKKILKKMSLKVADNVMDRPHMLYQPHEFLDYKKYQLISVFDE